MRRSFLLLCSFVIIELVRPPIAAAQDDNTLDLDLRPLLATGDDVSEVSPGIGYQLVARQTLERSTRTYFLDLDSQGAWTADASLNTRSSYVTFAAGGVINFTSPGTADIPIGADPNEIETTGRRDYGRLDVALDAQYETDQTFDEQNLAGGLEVGYVHPSLPYVPSLVLHLDGTVPVRSAVRDTLDADQPFVRLRILSSATLPLRSLVSVPLSMHLAYAFNQEIGSEAAWKEHDFHRSNYVAAALSYGINQSLPLVDEVYVETSYGRIPPALNKRTLFKIGVVFGVVRKHE